MCNYSHKKQHIIITTQYYSRLCSCRRAPRKGTLIAADPKRHIRKHYIIRTPEGRRRKTCRKSGLEERSDNFQNIILSFSLLLLLHLQREALIFYSYFCMALSFTYFIFTRERKHDYNLPENKHVLVPFSLPPFQALIFPTSLPFPCNSYFLS